MRQALAVLALLLCSITSSLAQFSVSIGVNLPVYPQLVRVPGYPVYYAPQLNSNYFFYDGMYWVYVDDNWYASTWYNGPWELVAPDFVPLFVLRVPVRYYRRPPVYFRGWRSDAPPRWGDHWGNTWYDNHRDWDRWNRSAAPAPAPLPVYQRQYSGNRYPRPEQQMTLQTRNYRYEPRDATVQRQYQAQRAQMPAAATPAPDRQRATSSPAPQQQAARPPSSPQSRPPQTTQRDAQQAARPPGSPPAQAAAHPPTSPSSQARPPSSPQGRPPQPEQREAQQAARPPSSPQGRPPIPGSRISSRSRNTSANGSPRSGGDAGRRPRMSPGSTCASTGNSPTCSRYRAAHSSAAAPSSRKVTSGASRSAATCACSAPGLSSATPAAPARHPSPCA